MGAGAIRARPPIGGLSRPPTPSAPADGVHLLHSMGDIFAVMDSLQHRNPATAVIVGAGYIGPDAKSFVLHPSPPHISTSSLPVVDSADQQFGQPLADGSQLEAGKIPLWVLL